MPGGMVRGRKIAGETEYKAALEDAKLIDKLLSETDMKNKASVEKLYTSMQTGEVRFKTIVGRDFDDEIYERMEQFKHQGSGDSDTISNGKKFGKSSKKKSDSTKTNIKVDKSQRNTSISQKNMTSVKKSDSINKNTYSVDEAANAILKRAARRRNIIMAIAAVVAVGSLAYFLIYSKTAYKSQAAYDELASLKGSDPISDNIEVKPLFTLAEAEEMPDILNEYKNIYLKNKSVVGWLTIDDTNIDYPVMQTVNNEYYLNHDLEGNDDNNGALFMDCNCNPVFRSTNLIIYGHHMKSGKMFGGLKKYQSEEYCKEHNVIKFDTIYEKSTYEVMYVFKADITNAEDVSFKYYQFIDAVSEAEFNSNMETMAEMSLYDTGVTASYGDELLTLSTCDGSTSTTRFVVVAKRTDNIK